MEENRTRAAGQNYSMEEQMKAITAAEVVKDIRKKIKAKK